MSLSSGLSSSWSSELIDRIYIPTHGRAGHNLTIACLERLENTIPITLVIDESETPMMYRAELAHHGVSLAQFDRRSIDVDTMRPSSERTLNAVVYARCYIDSLAREAGDKHYCVLDDDYSTLCQLSAIYPAESRRSNYLWREFCDAAEEFLDADRRIIAVASGQGGDVFGPKDFTYYRGLTKRKVMNTFVFATDRPALCWRGVANEDVNAYLQAALDGYLCITLGKYQTMQGVTQARVGGLTELYRAVGTAWKSWTSTAVYPAACAFTLIAGTRSQHWRIHHRIDWPHLCPKIISSRFRQPIER